MDLHLVPGASATEAERDAVDAVVGEPKSSWEGGSLRDEIEGYLGHAGRSVHHRRHLLLPAFNAVQARVGFISAGALNYICQRLSVAPAEAYGVASFYALLATEPRPPVVAHVCDDIACRTNGALDLCAAMEASVGPEGQAGLNDGATWFRSPCLGVCERAPGVLVQRAGDPNAETVVAPATADGVLPLLQPQAPSLPVHLRRTGSPSAPQTQDSGIEDLRLLRRVGRVDPESLDEYRTHGGYDGLRAAFDLGPEGVIREVTDAGLLGRGGAAFPTGRKWAAVAHAPARPHYVVCNADESEPGTFKDRVLLEEDPFTIIEALTIAGYATGCERGYLYIRGEYPLAIARTEHAIRQARARGFLGSNIMGEGFDFEIEVRRGAGAYICGEETAIFNSIEGHRGEPRSKPPFPTEAGLFHKPTLVNNVETLASIPGILVEGGPAYAAIGVPGSAGTKLFCVSGHVAEPGVYELPFGATLRQLLEEAGGLRKGSELQAILLGGAAGTFVTAEDLDVPLTFAGTRAIGASLGSGVVMVFDQTVDMLDLVLRIAGFFRDESCGQCVPCRVGTERQEEVLRRLAAGKPFGSREAEAGLLADIGLAMADASICGLGQTAAAAVQSAVTKLRLLERIQA